MSDRREVRWWWLGPAGLAAINLPLALGLIAPNPWYGFRTAASLASEQAWYSANTASGIAGVVAGTIASFLTIRLQRAEMSSAQRSTVFVILLLGIAALMIAAGALAT